ARGPWDESMHDFRGAGTPVKDSAAVVRGLPHERELELSNHADVELAAAQTPEQFGLATGIDFRDRAVGTHHLCPQHVIRSKTVSAAEGAHTTAERIPDDADGRRGSAQGHQPVGARSVYHRVPPGTGADRGTRRVSVDRCLT